MVHALVAPGDRFVAARSENPTVIVHAVVRKDGRLGLLLINTDLDHPADVTLDLGIWHGSGRAARIIYRPGTDRLDYKEESNIASGSAVSVPAGAIVDLILSHR
jgi:hypothetical protein